MTTRWHWGMSVALVYAVFATGTLGLVAFAMRQRVDLVSADYYAESLSHDARMGATARADALGESFSLSVVPAARMLVLEWPRGMTLGDGHIALYRAADATSDRRMSVLPDASGRQTISVSDLASGLWTVRVDWVAGGERYFAERRVILP